MTEVYTELLQENSELEAKILRLEQENKNLKKQIESQKGLITVGGKQQYQYLQRIDELEQEVKHWQMECREAKAKGEWTYDLVRKKVDRLEQENKALQAYKDINEDFKKAWGELNEKYKQLRSALEEIRDYLYTLTTVDSDFPNTETYMRINDKIEEVLNEGK